MASCRGATWLVLAAMMLTAEVASAFRCPSLALGRAGARGGARACSSWRADFKVFFDVVVDEKPAGRMTFKVSQDFLPKTTENFRALMSGEKRIIDPLLSYQNCQFEYGPQYVEGTGNYKVRSTTGEEEERSMTGSAVVACLQRKGKNVFGKEKIAEPQDLVTCRHKCPGPGGGYYYGMEVDLVNADAPDEEDDAGRNLISTQLQKPLGLILEEEPSGQGVFVAEVSPGSNAERSGNILPGDSVVRVGEEDCSAATLEDVLNLIGNAKSFVSVTFCRSEPSMASDVTVLTIPVGGPGHGMSRFDIIRVSDSPSSWKQRLLLNQAVIGRMEETTHVFCQLRLTCRHQSGRKTLQLMARARKAPRIVDCGVL
ncbi:hypothetical protein GUITHDRAFT_150119 [Guillardia theta CCMP2712]|uniref:PDZ domain-containing protein n=1 Tax=Guillardia theta (strain CCMP2712) TaxID=905079 RepID=L1K0N4_GUITC|nr:hypothetical protein GUITHDRAFT_150119 [Guillardia theta CCMP2712]EKX54010.1 hypothetical protein GUITHDRAFT_150119 [Guillardia theta CCMP2712]|eukprot:XP_005840990.1 hypothetical protein GUITHDRAFT_150119 [Guillardia theta CCMP2712]